MAENKVKKGFRLWKLPLYGIGILLLAAVILLIVLSITEYRPKEQESLLLRGAPTGVFPPETASPS